MEPVIYANFTFWDRMSDGETDERYSILALEFAAGREK
jgi:hypothetical protein